MKVVLYVQEKKVIGELNSDSRCSPMEKIDNLMVKKNVKDYMKMLQKTFKLFLMVIFWSEKIA